MAKQNSWFFHKTTLLPLLIIHLEVILTFPLPSHPTHEQDLAALKSLPSLPSPAWILQPSRNTTVSLLPLLLPNIRLNPLTAYHPPTASPLCQEQMPVPTMATRPAWSGSCPLLHPDYASATFLLAVPEHLKLLPTWTWALTVPSIEHSLQAPCSSNFSLNHISEAIPEYSF